MPIPTMLSYKPDTDANVLAAMNALPIDTPISAYDSSGAHPAITWSDVPDANDLNWILWFFQAAQNYILG